MQFTNGGKGRIFVDKEENIPELINIIKNRYDIDTIPTDFITVFSDDNFESVRVDSFVYDMEPILYEAWDRGIKCFCVFGDAFRTNNKHMKFPHKKCGRIYVEKESDMLVLKGIMIGMDSCEFDYMPDDLIAVFKDAGSCHNKYVGKFDDLDMGIVIYYAWQLGVKCFCVFSSDDVI
jgi:hypothetical protein